MTRVHLLLPSSLALLTALVACEIPADKALECSQVCSLVETCEATPPSPAGIFGEALGSTGNAAADCAVNCVQEESPRFGYADCQVECLSNAACEDMNDCWDATSKIFEEYCGGASAPVAPAAGAADISNGTTTGSAEADAVVDNAAVESSVDGSDFVVNYGDDPPIVSGLFSVSGAIDDSSNARPAGSTIATELCFHNHEENANGWTTDYCEYEVPGILSAPITGEGNAFTMYFEYPGQATVLFSGTTDGAGNVENAEALVVYLYSTDVWEHSFTDWTFRGDCDGSQCTP
jgi:hypothetical protein